MQFVLRFLVLRLWTLLYKITVIEFSSAMAATSTVHWESNTFSASLTSVKEWSRKSAAIPTMLETSFTISYSMQLGIWTWELFIIRNSPNPFEWIHRGCLKWNVLGTETTNESAWLLLESSFRKRVLSHRSFHSSGDLGEATIRIPAGAREDHADDQENALPVEQQLRRDCFKESLLLTPTLSRVCKHRNEKYLPDHEVPFPQIWELLEQRVKTVTMKKVRIEIHHTAMTAACMIFSTLGMVDVNIEN